LLFCILVRNGLQTLVGAQLVYGHGDQSGSHAQLTENITVNSTLNPRTIAESYDEAILPLGRKKSCSLLILLILFFSIKYKNT
jgi:hypothetical protein